jgi:hypothetical protein
MNRCLIFSVKSDRYICKLKEFIYTVIHLQAHVVAELLAMLSFIRRQGYGLPYRLF